VRRLGQSPFLALRSPPYPFHLPTDDPEAAIAPADAAHAAGSRPTGANGQAGAAKAFADRWGELTGRRHRVSMRLGLYDLPGLAALVWSVSGTDRPATMAACPLVERWMAGFAVEVGVAPLSGSSCVPAIEDGRVRLWCGPEPVVMAQASVATGGASRVHALHRTGQPHQQQHLRGHRLPAELGGARPPSGLEFGVQAEAVSVRVGEVEVLQDAVDPFESSDGDAEAGDPAAFRRHVLDAESHHRAQAGRSAVGLAQLQPDPADPELDDALGRFQIRIVELERPAIPLHTAFEVGDR
jgi:hypothetical protein